MISRIWTTSRDARGCARAVEKWSDIQAASVVRYIIDCISVTIQIISNFEKLQQVSEESLKV
jgi:hypothetical protein